MTDADLPPELQGPAAWFGPAMAARDDWLEHFTDAEVAELETAATAWAHDARRRRRRAAVPLPLLAPRLARIRAEVLRGRGFVLLRGLPVPRWPRRLSEHGLHRPGHAPGPRAAAERPGPSCSAMCATSACASSDPRRAHLPDRRAPDLPHRQLRHRRPAVPAGGARGRRVGAGVVEHAVERDAPAPARPGARGCCEPVATDRRGEVPPGCQAVFRDPGLQLARRRACR